LNIAATSHTGKGKKTGKGGKDANAADGDETVMTLDVGDPISCGDVKLADKGMAEATLKKIFEDGEMQMDEFEEPDSDKKGMSNKKRAKKGIEVQKEGYSKIQNGNNFKRV
jgi:hypothetical protein